MIRWLQVWLRQEPEPGAEPEPDPVEVGAAELGPVPEDPAAPAQVELRVVAAGRHDGQPATRRWLLAEAWWAEAFTLPRFRELAVWGFVVLPWTVVAHFAARLQRAWRGPGIAGRVARVLWQSLGLLLAVLLFPLLAVGVLVVVVLRVAAVAHSQGAAIAHRALRRVPPDERKLASFVTVGSGQTKLVDLESLRDSDAAREVWLAPAGLVVMATSIWLLLDSLRPESGEPAGEGAWMGPLWLTLMGLLFLCFGIAAAWPRRQPDPAELDVDAERGWLDLYASHDPVANGALFHLSSMPGRQLPLTSRPVVNFASPLRDHTGYWRNRDEFVAALAASLADAAGQTVDRPGSSDASGPTCSRWSTGARARRCRPRPAGARGCWPSPSPPWPATCSWPGSGTGGTRASPPGLLETTTAIPVGVGIGLVIAILSLPLLAATLPPLLAASATMRRLERRLRAWAHAEPPALTAETPAAPQAGDAVGAVLEPGGSA